MTSILIKFTNGSRLSSAGFSPAVPFATKYAGDLVASEIRSVGGAYGLSQDHGYSAPLSVFSQNASAIRVLLISLCTCPLRSV
jgi:hypothetical protein